MTARTEATILHVDLDAFYAAVEVLEQPSLVGKPVVVGGLGPRGVVSTANYHARQFGVHSALPTAIARRRCPQAVYITPRIERYREYSVTVMRVLHDVTPLVEPISLDEAFLDVAGARRLHGEPSEIARAIRTRITAETGGLTASIGIATTKLLAKIASDRAKPDGVLALSPRDELEFLHPLPVARLWGVGKATLERLERIGVRTVGDLAVVDESRLVGLLGPAAGRHLAALARNDDPRPVEPDREARSIGNEETFPVDLTDRDQVARELQRLTDRVARRLRQADVRARTVVLKLRYPDFHTITRSRTLEVPVDGARELHAVARALFEKVDIGAGIRLLGVHGQQLVGANHEVSQQLNLFSPAPRDDAPNRDNALDRASDAVRDRFGDAAVRPASLLRKPVPDPEATRRRP